MTLDMSAEDVAREVRSIFKESIKEHTNFYFQYLQATGGGTKSLTVPSQSASVKWMLFQVSHLSARSGTIYILAQDELDLNDKTLITHTYPVCSLVICVFADSPKFYTIIAIYIWYCDIQMKI